VFQYIGLKLPVQMELSSPCGVGAVSAKTVKLYWFLLLWLFTLTILSHITWIVRGNPGFFFAKTVLFCGANPL
ncbi:MAG: hypothetical protein RR336_09535, partial [Oscillospiraceae bacterium]